MNFKFGSIASCLLMWASSHVLFAQNTEMLPPSQPKSRLQISDLYIQTGWSWQQKLPFSLADFRTLAPNSSLLKQDFEGYKGRINGMYGGSSFGMLLGINLRDKPNWQLRVGLQRNAQQVYGNYSKYTTTPYDTLVSAQTGERTYIDSVHISSIVMRHSTQSMRLEASLLYRTNPERRWSFFAGFGGSLNFNVNGYTEISRYQDSYKTSQDRRYDANSWAHSFDSGEKEVFKNRNTMGFSIFAPIGVDFRLAKKHPVLSRVHLTYEIRPFLTSQKMESLPRFWQTGTQSRFGLRLVLGKK